MQTMLPALLAGLCALGTLPAQAQSRYTLTTIGKAWSNVQSEVVSPQLMEADGTVRGVVQYAIPFSFDGNISCFFCTLYGVREATWRGTGSRATQTLGTKDFLPLMANDKGTLVGRMAKGRSRGYSISFDSYPLDPYGLARSHLTTGVGFPVNVMRRQGSSTLIDITLNPQTSYEGHVVSAINTVNDLVGWSAETGLIRQQGAWSPLPGNTTDRLTTLRPTALDDGGTAWGNVTVRDGVGNVTSTPVRWSQGSLQNLGGAELQGWDVRQVNKAEQVLLTKSLRPSLGRDPVMMQSAVWHNGQLSLIVPPAGYIAQATAMNDRGQVVGCLQSSTLNADTARDSMRTFIWQNGVTTDLREWLQARGLTLPSTWRVYCPLAINASGSILLNYFDTASQTRMFVRLNAQP